MRARYAERIVCMTEETTETLYALGEERRIVGISGFTVRPPRARKEKRPAVFRDLDDYWQPYLAGGSSIAQRYAASLGDVQRDALRERLQSILPMAEDGSIRLLARAWAVRGTK